MFVSFQGNGVSELIYLRQVAVLSRNKEKNDHSVLREFSNYLRSLPIQQNILKSLIEEADGRMHTCCGNLVRNTKICTLV